MKQTLSLKLGQQLTMTPQLQQAIKLLQLSALDLEQEIQEMLTENPMLEYEEEGAEDPASSSADNTQDSTSNSNDSDASTNDASTDTDPSSEADLVDQTSGEEIPDDLPVDSNWDDVYPTTTATSSGGDDWDPDDRNSYEDTLIDHLLWQLNLTPMSDVDRAIATALIDGIDDDGMLTADLADVAAAFNAEDPDIEIEEVLMVLKRIQQFDPVGVAARNLQECLAIQLNALNPADHPHLELAKRIINDHFELLAGRDFSALMRKTKLDQEELGEVFGLIQSLNPRPGSALNTGKADYVVPDVIVRKEELRGHHQWVVELNNDALPKVRINSQYADLAKSATSAKDSAYLRDSLAEARWFLKSLQSRNETLLRVASKIVEKQRGFLDYGEEAMKPMVLADIAEEVDMHESTISRVTSRKYMHTPRGVYELKYFFSSHVSTASGGEVSSTAIRALIRKLTAEEDPKKPLSDSKIAAILGEQNIKVARRTVAKYRESMNIPPSNERKRLV